MATVRFSDQLKSTIVSNAKAMFAQSVDTALKSHPTDWADRMYECFFPPEVKAQMDALPDYMLDTKGVLDFTGFDNAPNDYWQTSHCTLKTWETTHLSLMYSKPRRMPHKFSTQVTGYKASSWLHSTADFNDARWDWLKPEVKAYTERVFHATEKRDRFVSGVRQVINTYSTLAPALKAWPPLWDLIPEDVRARHREVKERTKREVDELSVNLNDMTAAVVLNKMTR